MGRNLTGIIIGLFIVLGAIALIFWPCLDFEGITLETRKWEGLGLKQELPFKVRTGKSGLRFFSASLEQEGREKVFFEEKIPAQSFRLGSSVDEKAYQVPLDLKTLGFREGKAKLKVRAEDYSLFRGIMGHVLKEEWPVFIDYSPPQVTPLSSQHYLYQGGAGFVVYQVSKDAVASGVEVEGKWFPGYPWRQERPEVRVAFFALPYEVPKVPRPVLMARDAAGNTAQNQVDVHFRPKAFRQDKINLTENLLDQILSGFSGKIQRTGDRLKDFFSINRELRAANARQIEAICKETQPRILWEGVFLRLPDASPMAGFADARTYLFQGQEVDRQVHLGVDLASLAHSPVPAANTGVVLFVGDLGIYGQSVILDHGLGLSTLYAHLSRIQVTKGQKVSKGEVLGNTGTTGLAGGDHLHFGMMVQGVPVNPIEWWDSHWIKDNFTGKLAQAGLIELKEAKGEKSEGKKVREKRKNPRKPGKAARRG
jgi:hypothetical protein